MRFKFLQVLFSILTLAPFTSFGQAAQDIKRLSTESKVYSPNGNPKALGLDFRIKYLSDWKVQEGERPHVVQKFISNTNQAQVSYGILVNKLPGEPMGRQEIDDLLADVEEMVPAGCTFISKNPNLIVDGERAALIEFKGIRTSEQTAVGLDIIIYTYSYNIIYKNYLIQLHFSVGGTKDTVALKELYSSYKPFFQLVATSFVITSKWK